MRSLGYDRGAAGNRNPAFAFTDRGGDDDRGPGIALQPPYFQGVRGGEDLDVASSVASNHTGRGCGCCPPDTVRNPWSGRRRNSRSLPVSEPAAVLIVMSLTMKSSERHPTGRIHG